MKKKSSPPLQVKIISLLMLLHAVITIAGLIITLATISVAGFITELEETDPNKALELQLEIENSGMEYNESSVLALMVLGAAILFLIEALFVVLAIFLWKGHNWARITTATFGFILAPFSLISLVTGEIFSLIDLAIYLAISLVLLLNKDVKKYCTKKKRKS